MPPRSGECSSNGSVEILAENGNYDSPLADYDRRTSIHGLRAAERMSIVPVAKKVDRVYQRRKLWRDCGALSKVDDASKDTFWNTEEASPSVCLFSSQGSNYNLRTSIHGSPAVERMSVAPVAKKVGLVYKRRKLGRDCSALSKVDDASENILWNTEEASPSVCSCSSPVDPRNGILGSNYNFGVTDKLLDGKGRLSKHKSLVSRRASSIRSMLKDAGPYVCPVRLGKDFQANVPEGTCKSSRDEGYFDKPLELIITRHEKSPGLKKNTRRNTITNWIQCRNVLDPGETVKRAVCGKWRRAPLFAVQTDKWDCSCCLPWDPIHADCAVSQELGTAEVVKQLKYIRALRDQIGDRSKRI